MGTPKNKNDDRNIQQYKHGHQDAELRFLCLVPENLHSYAASDRASDKAREKKRGFRDPPFALHGLTFVDAVDHKRNDIDDQNIYQKEKE